jgi:uncharacterized protein YndB with AHSA1/START domain
MIRICLAGILAIGFYTAPVAAEVVESSEDHFVTRNSVTVKAGPKAAWLELIAPGGWWNKAHSWSGDAANLSLTPQGGGCFCERIPEKESSSIVGLSGSAQHMTVVMAEPMKVLRMRGALGPLQSEPVDGVLTVTMQPDKATGGTKLVWEYVVSGHMRFEVAKISKAVDGVMSEQLSRLADKLGPVGGATEPVKSEKKPAAADEVGAALDRMDKTDD